jgi:hypothetical protein
LLHQAHVYAGDGLAKAMATDSVLQPLKLSDPAVGGVVAFPESLRVREPALSGRKVVLNSYLKTKG